MTGDLPDQFVAAVQAESRRQHERIANLIISEEPSEIRATATLIALLAVAAMIEAKKEGLDQVRLLDDDVINEIVVAGIEGMDRKIDILLSEGN